MAFEKPLAHNKKEEVYYYHEGGNNDSIYTELCPTSQVLREDC